MIQCNKKERIKNMPKIDINLDRSITLNMGNFNSIKPTVGLTIKDVELKNSKIVYEKISNFLDALLAKEIIKMSEEIKDIEKIGAQKYFTALKEGEQKIDESIESFIENR